METGVKYYYCAPQRHLSRAIRVPRRSSSTERFATFERLLCRRRRRRRQTNRLCVYICYYLCVCVYFFRLITLIGGGLIICDDGVDLLFISTLNPQGRFSHIFVSRPTPASSPARPPTKPPRRWAVRFLPPARRLYQYYYRYYCFRFKIILYYYYNITILYYYNYNLIDLWSNFCFFIYN